jgi:hypothetical protein
MADGAASRRPFPIEAVLLFPLAGPLLLAFVLALLYGLVLMLFLNPAGIIAFPVYFVFWMQMFYMIAGPPLLAAGALYAIAVRLFAPPNPVTASVSGLAAAGGFWLAGFPSAGSMERLGPSGPDALARDLAMVAAGCILLVLPGWLLTHKLRARLGRQ